MLLYIYSLYDTPPMFAAKSQREFAREKEHKGHKRSKVYNLWCREPDSNRHGSYEPGDFKSPASANSATPAGVASLCDVERAIF